VSSETGQRLCGAHPCTVACFVHAAQGDPLTRLTDVQAWMEQELQERHAEQQATVFRFCALNPAAVPPLELVLGEHWVHPFSTTPHPLIDLTEILLD
jgi:hypothetical protein